MQLSRHVRNKTALWTRWVCSLQQCNSTTRYNKWDTRQSRGTSCLLFAFKKTSRRIFFKGEVRSGLVTAAYCSNTWNYRAYRFYRSGIMSSEVCLIYTTLWTRYLHFRINTRKPKNPSFKKVTRTSKTPSGGNQVFNLVDMVLFIWFKTYNEQNKQSLPRLSISALELRCTEDSLKNRDSDSRGFIRHIPEEPGGVGQKKTWHCPALSRLVGTESESLH